MRDIRHALRRLSATPVVTLSATTCLAIAIWMTCIVSALATGFFWPNLGVPEPDRVVQLEVRGLYSSRPVCCGRTSSKGVVDSLAKSPLFAAAGYYSNASVRIEGDSRRRRATVLSSGMMGVLRPSPLLGRGFVASDDTNGAVIMLSYQLWRTLYASDSSIVGRSIRLRNEGIPFTVIGVMREAFLFPRNEVRPDVYLARATGRQRDIPIVTMLARVADDVEIAEAREAARGIAARNARADREAFRSWRHALYPRGAPPAMATGPVDARLERYYNEPWDASSVRLVILIVACGFAVVAIAAANVANLLLVRGAARRQEIAVRMSLGASRWRIVRELLAEAVIIAVAGVSAGLAAAAWQWSLIDRGFVARHFFGEIDARIAGVAVSAGVALTALVAIWPALRATSMRLEQVLRDSRRSGFGASPLDGILGRLVAASTAATVTLSICAMLLGMSARDFAGRTGLMGRDLMAVEITFDERPDRATRVSTAAQALARVRATPGVSRAAIGMPPSSGSAQSLFITASGQPETRFNSIDVYSVSSGFFVATGIPLLRGRDFSARENRDSSGAVIISRGLASRLFAGRGAIGERFRIRNADDSSVVNATVVGVAEDARAGGRSAGELYVSLPSAFPIQTSIIYGMKKSGRAADAANALRGMSGVTAGGFSSAAQRASASDPGRHYLAIGFGLFAVVALILVAVGTYGVVAYSAARRTHEIGVRMALGAAPGRVTWMVIEQGLKVSLVGIIGGLILSFALARVLGAFVPDIRTGYPVAIGLVVTLIAVVSVIASGIPGLRAGRLNPVEALRAE